jgi:hypothetical protein
MSEGHGLINSRTLMTPQAPGRNVSESEWDRIFKQRQGETEAGFQARRGTPMSAAYDGDMVAIGLVNPPSGRPVEEADVLRMQVI